MRNFLPVIGFNALTTICYAKNLYLNDKLVTNLVIPEGIMSIGIYVFRGCTGLTSIEIPNSVTSISSSAFSGCTGLTSIEISNSIRCVQTRVFAPKSTAIKIDGPKQRKVVHL